MPVPKPLRENSLIGGLIEFFIPPLCTGCAGYYDGEDGICPDCRESIKFIKGAVCLGCHEPIPEKSTTCPQCGEYSLPLFSLGEYESPLSDMIIQMKFKGTSFLANEFAVQIAARLGDAIMKQEADSLVPIPLHPSRERQRGYNQAGLVAARLSELLGIESNESLIVRTKRRRHQAKLELSAREANIKSVFEPTELSGDGQRLILVDDVVTSGATVREAASCLKSVGHEVAAVISISHKV
ncbi:MAG: ComF family protein [bacterium]|nr:ComF family protein [bacterium]